MTRWEPSVLAGAASLVRAPDPLLFLLALALGRAALRPLALATAAFTAASLLGLLVASLGIFAPGAFVLGPALALSVAYLALDDLTPDPTPHRWALALAFGLVHGVAFAASPGRPAEGLAAFALGVGASALLSGLLLIALVAWARQRFGAGTRVETAVRALLLVGAVALGVLRITGR